MPFWHIDYLELKVLKKQLVQEEHSDPLLSPRKQEISLLCEKYPSCTRRIESILITRDREFKTKGYLGGFPGGAVVENLPANAGHTGSSPGLGRSHMPWSNWARESQLLSLRVWSLCSTTREAAMVRGPRTAMKSGPRLPQLDKALAQKRRPNTAKTK